MHCLSPIISCLVFVRKGKRDDFKTVIIMLDSVSFNILQVGREIIVIVIF